MFNPFRKKTTPTKAPSEQTHAVHHPFHRKVVVIGEDDGAKVYKNLAAASRATGLSTASLHRLCSERADEVKGFRATFIVS